MSQLIEILKQTDDFIFVNKPSGMPVHRSKECSDVESLVQVLRKQVGPVFPIHRLDRGVSGVIGFGKTSEAARDLQILLDNEKTEKIYLALVRGTMASGVFTVEKTLTNESEVVQEAKTEFTPLVAGPFCSVVKARIFTGRRHQIRRHLSHTAHHIFGDRHYGKGRLNKLYQEKYGLNRIFLHSWELKLSNQMRIHTPLPHDLHSVLKQLFDEGLLPCLLNPEWETLKEQL
jgi:tRNA pseudouridine65 synthase